MQREEVKFTKLKVREDYPTAIASEAYGANVGCVAFNLNFIALRDPVLVVRLQKLYKAAWALRDKPKLEPNNEAYTKALNNIIKEFK